MISLDIDFNKSEVSNDNIATFKTDVSNYVLHKTIEDLFNEFNIVYQEEWHSKYNEDVVYDYEPFCNEGYDKIYKVKSSNHVMFIISILKNYIRKINELDEQLKLKVKKIIKK